jgi:DNA-binding FrmR family transcriptional regulator
MAASTELEAGICLLAEGEDRLRQQLELIEKLIREDKPTEAAMDRLAAMRATLNEIRTHIDYLRETADRRE